MQVVYLSTARIPSRAANSVHIMKMCAALAANRHTVTLITPSVGKIDVDIYRYYDVPPSFRIMRFPRPDVRFGEYFYALTVQLCLMFKDVDVFLSRHLLSSVFTSWKRGIQILELHQPIPGTSRVQRRMFDLYRRKRNFSKLVVITKPLKEIFVKEYGIQEKQVFVAPDGADIREKKPRNQKTRSKLQVGYLGHLYKGRGVQIILDMARECDWAEFHIVGGTDRDIQRVKRQASSSKNVKIHGFVSPSTAESIRAEMDVLLAPYQRKVGLGTGTLTTEMWMSPLKVFEYMASGKALICSDIPVLHEVLIPEQNCLMSPPDDVESWVMALGRLFEDVNLRELLGSRAKQDILYKYSWKVRANNILRMIRND